MIFFLNCIRFYMFIIAMRVEMLEMSNTSCKNPVNKLLLEQLLIWKGKKFILILHYLKKRLQISVLLANIKCNTRIFLLKHSSITVVKELFHFILTRIK